MSTTAKKEPPEYLRTAREKAGCSSRSTAAMKVPYSPETIGRHERGEVDIAPADAVTYAEGYKAPDILYRYCSDCPVGRKTGRTATDRPLPYATLRVRRMVEDAQAVTAVLEKIALDGEVDQAEREDFRRAVTFLGLVQESITDILLFGATLEITKTATAGPRQPG